MDRHLRAMEEAAKKRDEDLLAKDKELKSKDEDLVAKDEALLAKDRDLISKDRDLISKDKEVLAKDREILAKDKELELKTQDLEGAEEHCAHLDATNQKLAEERDEIKKALEDLKSTSVDHLQDSPRLECDSPEEEVCLFGISSEAKEKIRNLESENKRLENKIRDLENQLTSKVRVVILIIGYIFLDILPLCQTAPLSFNHLVWVGAV